MSDAHNAERVRALQGCAELYRIAASHLEADPPNYEEASRAIDTAMTTGHEIRESVILDYVMSGGFQRAAFKNHTQESRPPFLISEDSDWELHDFDPGDRAGWAAPRCKICHEFEDHPIHQERASD